MEAAEGPDEPESDEAESDDDGPDEDAPDEDGPDDDGPDEDGGVINGPDRFISWKLLGGSSISNMLADVSDCAMNEPCDMNRAMQTREADATIASAPREKLHRYGVQPNNCARPKSLTTICFHPLSSVGIEMNSVS